MVGLKSVVRSSKGHHRIRERSILNELCERKVKEDVRRLLGTECRDESQSHTQPEQLVIVEDEDQRAGDKRICRSDEGGRGEGGIYFGLESGVIGFSAGSISEALATETFDLTNC
jgi:hypothetical protein